MWLYVDNERRVLGANLHDMDGNTGWELAEVPEDFDIDLIWDDHGAALYKIVDGQLITRTEDERQADWPEPEPVHIDPARQLRADVDYLAMMMEVEL